MNDQFTNIKACVFDAYGTLFDVHSAAAKHSHRLGDLEQSVSQMWRSKQLEYTWLRALMGAYDDFWTVTGDALDYALASHGVKDGELRDQLMNAYLNLSCFDEVPQVLKQLKDNGMKTAVLSNGSPNMLGPVVENSGVGQYIDACISVDEVKTFKPTAVVYQLACDHLDVRADEVSFQSSNCWDAIGAAYFGFQVVWCNRYNQQLDRLPATPHVQVTDLTALLDLVGLNGR